VAAALVLLIGAAWPLVLPQYMNLGIGLLLLAGWAAAWDIVGGWAGQLSLGHAAFIGLGAYTVALTANQAHLAPWWSLGVTMLLAAGLAWGWGAITFRLRGPYFALSTLAVAEILRLAAINERWLTGGAGGIFISALAQPFGLDLFNRRVEYYTGLVYLAAVIGIVAWLGGRRFGYQLRAVREDEEAAMAAGIHPAAVKIQAFVLSGALTAAGGLLYGIFLSALEPHRLFEIPLSVRIALTAIIGGRGTVWGPLVGAALLTVSGEVFRSLFAEANLLIYGLLIIVVVLFVPRGVVGEWERFRVRRRYERVARG
jgi:branched-chain amino acid transport system permease protein